MATLADGGWKHGMQTGRFGGADAKRWAGHSHVSRCRDEAGTWWGICGFGGWFGDCQNPGAIAKTWLLSLPSAPRPLMLSGQASKN